MTLFGMEQAARTSDDYYTPAWIFDAPAWIFDALALTFDLDVASPPEPPPWIPARRFLTMADDGLTAEWTGRVWMNPPYSDCAPWVERFIRHAHGVCIVQVSKSAWWASLWRAADAVVMPGPQASKFVGGDIYMPCALAAFGADCVAALARLGVTRCAA